MKRTVLAIPFVVAMSAACVEAPELGESMGAVMDGDGNLCPKLGCSSNSAFLGPTEFHELEWTGANANFEGFKLVGLTKLVNGTRLNYRPAIVNNTQLVGQTLRFNLNSGFYWATVLQGADLIDAELQIDGPGPHNPDYAIRITGMHAQHLWQPRYPGDTAPEYVNTYRLEWYDAYPGASNTLTNLCVNPPNRTDGEGQQNDAVFEAILFTGDRYNVDHKWVTATTPAAAGTWFNIGCAGGVLWKLALNRHTYATRGTTTTTLAQRQAMLKMYTSDVCDTGEAFTVTGTPLAWASTTGLTSGPIAVNTYEARWNETGAICMTTHRLNRTPDDMDGDETYQRPDQIHPACQTVSRRLPVCGPTHTNFYLVTASPALADP